MYCVTQAANAAPTPNAKVHKYLPGDVMRMAIEAPLDTASVTAIMPDGNAVILTYGKRAKVWQGYWEVPHGIGKGTYSAKLIAVDIEGVSYEGSSAPFYIGEPILTMMLAIGTGEAARPTSRPEKVAAPQPRPAEVESQPAKQKTGKKPAPKPATPKEDINLTKARLIADARDNMANRDYPKARAALEALLKIDPGNKEVKGMIERLNLVIKAGEAVQ